MNNTRKKWIYVAAAYTNPDPVENTNRAIQVGDWLAKAGYVPIIPHLTLLWHMVKPHEAQFWYDYTMDLMRRCDLVLRLEGYSVGADKEEDEARRLNIPVVYSWADLVVESMP